MTDAPSRARLIGIIILTRFLKLPLTRYEAVIEKVEGSPMFTPCAWPQDRQLWAGVISTNLFPRAQVLEPAGVLTPNAIGQLRKDEEGFCVSYRHPGLAREYLFDEGKMGRWRLRPEACPEFTEGASSGRDPGAETPTEAHQHQEQADPHGTDGHCRTPGGLP